MVNSFNNCYKNIMDAEERVKNILEMSDTRSYICVRRHKDLIYIKGVNIFNGDGLEQLKKKIYGIYDVEPQDQKLYFQGMLLAKETLEETGLEEEDFQMPHNPVVFELSVKTSNHDFEPLNVPDYAPLPDFAEFLLITDENDAPR